MAWKCQIKSEDYTGRTSLGLAKLHADNSLAHIEGPVALKLYSREAPITGLPMLTLPHNEMVELLQGIVDAAWDAGIRPQRQAETANQAMKAHLDDMRAIVAKTLDVPIK